jgi:hypothetical protein
MIRAICASVVAAVLLGGCGGVHGTGTGPSMSDLVVSLDGSPVAGAGGELTLDRYVSEFASVPAQERAEFTKAGFVTGWLRSTLDQQFGRRIYLLRFRDMTAAHDVFLWYRSFVTSDTFSANVNREYFGRVMPFKTKDNRDAYSAQLMFPAGPFVAVSSVTVAAEGDVNAARTEAIRIAVAESRVLP